MMTSFYDNQIEQLWLDFEDVPMDPISEQIETMFLAFPIGTRKEDIWKWFDEHHSKGVGYLMNEL